MIFSPVGTDSVRSWFSALANTFSAPLLSAALDLGQAAGFYMDSVGSSFASLDMCVNGETPELCASA